MMTTFFKKRKAKQKGAILLLTVVIISLVLITIAAVSSYKLTALAKQSARLNEALAYLTVMEEMGQIVAESYYEAERLAPGCDPGRTRFSIGAVFLCSPNGAANGICLTKEHGGVNRTFCLQPGATGAELVARYTPETQPHIFFDVTEKKEWSFANFIREKLSFPSASADYPDFPPWTPASDPWRGNVPQAGGAPGPEAVETPNETIAALPATPGGAGQQATSGVYGGGSREPWVPTPAWATTNEIFIPSCTADSQQRLGCMKCNATGVRCIQFRLCLSGAGGCAEPLIQRIAIY